MKKLKEDFPLSIKISLKKIFDKYRTLANAKGNGLNGRIAALLDQNEIKTATIPFQEFVFKSTQRYRDIINAAGEGYKLQLVEFDDQNSYIMACSIILNMYYGFKADFRRPFFYNIPNAQGDLRSYKVLFNADFIEISTWGLYFKRIHYCQYV